MGSDFLTSEEETVVQRGMFCGFLRVCSLWDRLFRLKHFPKPLPDQDRGRTMGQDLVYLAVQSSFRLFLCHKTGSEVLGVGVDSGFSNGVS